MRRSLEHKSKIIVLRGNSASGKSTIAKLLQEQVEPHPIVIEQDHFRRKIIKEKEREGEVINPELMLMAVEFGLKHGRDIIIEGILPNTIDYNNFFKQLLQLHPHDNYFFYFDIPFDVTLKRHVTKLVADEYGEAEMREWYREKDFLEGIKEDIIDESLSLEETLQYIKNKAELK